MTINFKSFNSIPQGGDIVDSWAITYKAILIRQELVDFETKEIRKQITFKGMIQNNQGSKQNIREIGVRQWKSYSLWSTYKFKNNDVIIIDNVRYRIMGTELWDTYYNYYKYDLTEDYTDNGTNTDTNTNIGNSLKEYM